MSDLMQQYQAQIFALQKENERLNLELKKVKDVAFKARLSDPIFDKPLCEVETNYEIING